MQATIQLTQRESTEPGLFAACCDALALVLDPLADYARTRPPAERAFLFAVRQGGLIVLGAMERRAGRRPTYTPKHSA